MPAASVIGGSSRGWRGPGLAGGEGAMSWPGEAWQEGLPARALQGVRELEQRLEWAQKERVQKQVQLDTLEAVLHKQRQKHEEERGTWALLAQERRDLTEACEQLERGRLQLSRELQAKGAQLSRLEGQLGRATQHIEELEEELRRCQAELDNLRPSTPLTHCWGPPGPAPPREEGAELGVWRQKSRVESRPGTPSMRLQPSSPTFGEEPPLHRGAAWHSVPPGGPAPPEDNQGIPPPGKEPSQENEGPGHGPHDMEAWELRGALQSVQRVLAQRTEQRDQAVTKVSALQRRVQQLLEALRSQRQRAGAVQRRMEQQEREHRQGLVELERRHQEELEQQGPQTDIPACPQHPQTRSFSTGSPSCGQAGAQWDVVPGARRPPELQAMRAEALGLRLAASESLHKGLPETCWQLHQGNQDQAGERRALTEMPLSQDAAMQHKEEEAQELQGALGPDRAEWERGELQALAAEVEALAWGAPGPGLPAGETQEVGELQALQGELRALALGKAEAEAQAAEAQERLQRLQEILGWQTERLALACETQSHHMAELLTEGHEREQELERLGWALEEAGRAHGLLEAEVGRLWALLGGETPPTGPPEPPPTVPEPGPPETPATGPLESPPTIPELGPPEAPATSLPEPPPTIPEPSPPELPATPAELPSIAQEPGPSKLPSPTPPELPCPPELPLGALELAVAGRVWDAPVDTSLLMGKQAWHSERAQLQNAPWELQKPAGQAGLQEQQEVALSRLLQENRALRAELALWQSQGRAECAASVIGDGQHQGTSSPPAPVTPGGRGQGDLAYVLQTPWPAMQDAQTQTEGLAEGGHHKELISAAFDHTQYEPYGLPEVVMKGFADIPSGPSCPYVLRRGFLGSTPLAPLAPKAEPEEDPRA